MVTLEQFVSKYLGQTKGYPTDEYYKGQCLSIVKLYIKECFGIDPPPSGTNSAYGYWSNFPSPLGTKFEKVANTDELIPEPGWIAIWQPWASNEYGHIAIVAEGSTTGTLKNYAQNWTSKVFQLESNRYTNVVGFLKPIKSSEETMTQDETRALDALKRYKIEFDDSSLEGTADTGAGARRDLANVQRDLDNARTMLESTKVLLKSAQDEVTRLTGQLNLKTQDNTALAEKLESANDDIGTLTAKLEEEARLKNQYRRYWEKCKQDNGLLEKIKLFIQKLFKR